MDPNQTEGPSRHSSPLLTRAEAIAFCRVSRRSFDRIIRPKVPFLLVGTRVLFHREDLVRWVERLRVGSTTATSAPEPTLSGSATKVGATMSPRAKEILALLQKPPPASTPRLFP